MESRGGNWPASAIDCCEPASRELLRRSRYAKDCASSAENTPQSCSWIHFPRIVVCGKREFQSNKHLYRARAMEKYHLKLTADETALVEAIDLSLHHEHHADGHAAYINNQQPILALIRSLDARKGLPDERLKYWLDPTYHTGRIKASRQDCSSVTAARVTTSTRIPISSSTYDIFFSGPNWPM